MHGTSHSSGGLAALITTFLLAGIMSIGPMFLGAARLWIELPLLGVAALLFALQGLRLAATPSIDTPRRADAIDLAVALFVIYSIARWLSSPAEYVSRIEVMDIVACAGVFFTCRYGMASRRYCMALLYLLVILGVGETALGYYLSNHLDWLPFGAAEQMQLQYAPRWIGTYESPNHYASLLVIAIGAALAAGSFSKLAWPMRIVLIYLAIMMLVGVMSSGSRGSWIALLAAICALVIMGIRNGTMSWWVPILGALALVIVAGGLFSLSPVVRDRLVDTQTLVVGGPSGAHLRARLRANLHAQVPRDALQIAHDHLYFGTGPATFAFIDPRYQARAASSKPALIHGDYLICLDDYGLVGFGLALFFIAAVTLKFFRPLIIDNRWQDRVLVATAFAAWYALLVHSLLDSNLHTPANALLLFSLTGMGLGRINGEKQMHWSTLSLAPLGRWLGWAVVVLSLIYGLEVARTALSDRVYENALAHQDVVPISDNIAAAEDALRYDPGNVHAMVILGDSHRSNAALQTDPSNRAREDALALEAYQKALQANSLDASVQDRIANMIGK